MADVSIIRAIQYYSGLFWSRTSGRALLPQSWPSRACWGRREGRIGVWCTGRNVGLHERSQPVLGCDVTWSNTSRPAAGSAAPETERSKQRRARREEERRANKARECQWLKRRCKALKRGGTIDEDNALQLQQTTLCSFSRAESTFLPCPGERFDMWT